MYRQGLPAIWPDETVRWTRSLSHTHTYWHNLPWFLQFLSSILRVAEKALAVTDSDLAHSHAASLQAFTFRFKTQGLGFCLQVFIMDSRSDSQERAKELKIIGVCGGGRVCEISRIRWLDDWKNTVTVIRISNVTLWCDLCLHVKPHELRGHQMSPLVSHLSFFLWTSSALERMSMGSQRCRQLE